jgi:ketol-acid reductoisomerase
MKKRKTLRVYSDKQADLRHLKGKTIAVLGYGNQGRAQALNLRDSGLDVVVGLSGKDRSFRQARQDGFRVWSMGRAVQAADLVSVLIPDHVHGEVFKRHIRPNLRPGRTLLFACGLSIHFGLVVPPEFVDVVMVAPHAPGEIMRNLFEQGKGVPCFVAVWQDSSGTAKKTALAYAKAIGCTRAGAFETAFELEAVGDLFGEQAVLCGGVPELVRAGFETLTEAGFPPENAYLECLHQLDFIVDAVKKYGIAGMYDRISRVAEYGSYVSGKKIVNKQVKERMARLLREIKSGVFLKGWIKEYESGMKNYRRLKRGIRKHPIEQVGRKIRTYSD